VFGRPGALAPEAARRTEPRDVSATIANETVEELARIAGPTFAYGVAGRVAAEGLDRVPESEGAEVCAQLDARIMDATRRAGQ